MCIFPLSCSIAIYMYLDGAQIHRLLNDVMIVEEIKGSSIHRVVEWPGIVLE